MDAVLDAAYTVTYLAIAVLAIHELRLDQTILAGISADALNFAVELSPDFAFPTDFLGFFAVFYSVAHVCTVCRAVERNALRAKPGLPPPRATCLFLLENPFAAEVCA